MGDLQVQQPQRLFFLDRRRRRGAVESRLSWPRRLDPVHRECSELPELGQISGEQAAAPAGRAHRAGQRTVARQASDQRRSLGALMRPESRRACGLEPQSESENLRRAAAKGRKAAQGRHHRRRRTQARRDRRPHVVVVAVGARAAEKSERLPVRVENHLMTLPEIHAHMKHPAVAKTHMRNLRADGLAAQNDVLLAPVELVRIAQIAAQRNMRLRRRRRLPFLRTAHSMTSNRVVAALVAQSPQIRISVIRLRFGRDAFSAKIPSSSERQGPIFGRGCVRCLQTNSVAPVRKTFRIVPRGTPNPG